MALVVPLATVADFFREIYRFYRGGFK